MLGPAGGKSSDGEVGSDGTVPTLDSGPTPDANLSGRVNLTLVVQSTVGSRQIAITSGEHDGQPCRLQDSPFVFSIENPSSVKLTASVDDFVDWQITPCNFTENQYTAVVRMTVDCAATALFGALPQ